MRQMEKNNNNSSNSLVVGRWPQTQIYKDFKTEQLRSKDPEL